MAHSKCLEPLCRALMVRALLDMSKVLPSQTPIRIQSVAYSLLVTILSSNFATIINTAILVIKVSGGMAGKISAAAATASRGIPVYIVKGGTRQMVEACVGTLLSVLSRHSLQLITLLAHVFLQ